MRLVDYSSDEEEESENPQPTSRPSLPTLPSSFHDLYSVKPRIGDDPLLHEGRIRGQPHVPGQWATHAYIEFRPTAELHALLHSIVTRAMSHRPQLKSLLYTEFGNMAALHVSLSRPLVLWTREKEDFLSKFTDAVHGLHLPPFELSVEDIECFVNHESTRKFLVLRLKMSPQLAAAVDDVVISFDRPPLYENPVYHISIAWASMACEMDQRLFDVLQDEFGKRLGEVTINVKEVKLKVGNEISSIPLN